MSQAKYLNSPQSTERVGDKTNKKLERDGRRQGPRTPASKSTGAYDYDVTHFCVLELSFEKIYEKLNDGTGYLMEVSQRVSGLDDRVSIKSLPSCLREPPLFPQQVSYHTSIL